MARSRRRDAFCRPRSATSSWTGQGPRPAEHLTLNEIAGICYVRTKRKPHLATVRSVLDEEPLPIKTFKRFPSYHQIPEGRERRKAVVALHYEGWASKSIARYPKVDRSTVRGVLLRWIDEGPAGLTT